MDNGSVFARRYWTYNVLDEVHQQAFEQLVGSQEWREQLTVNKLPLDKLVLTNVSCYAIFTCRINRMMIWLNSWCRQCRLNMLS